MASTKQQTPKKMTVPEAFRLWLSGKGRSELTEATGLGRKALRDAFIKHSRKTWAQLDQETGRAKKAKRAAKKSATKKAKVA